MMAGNASGEILKGGAGDGGNILATGGGSKDGSGGKVILKGGNGALEEEPLIFYLDWENKRRVVQSKFVHQMLLSSAIVVR